MTATDFGGHLIANSKVVVFPRVADNPRRAARRGQGGRLTTLNFRPGQ